jgi:hypothetical protein
LPYSVPTTRPVQGNLPTQEVIMTALKTKLWPWLMLSAVLLVGGLLVIKGTAGTIILAGGFIVLFGAGIRLISRNDPAPPEERRVPAGHSGV